MKYKLISILKKSAKGDIRLVQDENGTRFVQRYRDTDPALLKKLSQIYCPYIAQPTDYGEDNDGFVSIEEYVDGTPADEVTFTEKQAVKSLLELCKALKALHRNGIVHRDIKPSNIIVGNDGHICLIDFDSARLMKEYQSHDTDYLGTIGYAPPEQYGFTQTDARSDIYAFGMTMEEILGNAAKKLRYRRIIAKCTAFDPEKRYSDISLVEKALKQSIPFMAVVIMMCGVALITVGAFLLSCDSNPVSPAETTDTIPNTSEKLPSVPETPETPVDEIIQEQNKMTFETLQDENGNNYDSYEYIFYDDSTLHGNWILCATSKVVPDGDIYYPGTLEGHSPKYISVFSDGTLKTYNTGMRELATHRWTKGYCIDESTEIHKVEQMFVHTNTDGSRYMIYERKPIRNGDDVTPLIYFIYRCIDE